MCQRVNGRIADPNRNWPAKGGIRPWDYKSETEDGPGVAPLSEPESRLIFRILHAVEPMALTNIHSGMHGMFMPPDHTPIMVNSATALAQLKLQSYLNNKWIDGKCTLGAGGHAVGYVAYGTAMDFFRLGFQIPLAQTWEIYGNQRSEYFDCFSLFNPVEEEEKREYTRKWTAAILEQISLLHKGLLPGVKSPKDKFSRQVAELPKPNACGLTKNHVDAMDGLADIALGRGDRQERLNFVRDAIESTPTLAFPELPSPPPPAAAPTPVAAPISVELGKTEDIAVELNLDLKEKKREGRPATTAAAAAATTMQSFTTVLFLLFLATAALFVYSRVKRHQSRRSRPRRYRVWDVV